MNNFTERETVILPPWGTIAATCALVSLLCGALAYAGMQFLLAEPSSSAERGTDTIYVMSGLSQEKLEAEFEHGVAVGYFACEDLMDAGIIPNLDDVRRIAWDKKALFNELEASDARTTNPGQ